MATINNKWIKPGWVSGDLELAGDDLIGRAYVLDKHFVGTVYHYVVVGFPEPGYAGVITPNDTVGWKEWRVYRICPGTGEEVRLDQTFEDSGEAMYDGAMADDQLVRRAIEKERERRAFRESGALPFIFGEMGELKMVRKSAGSKKLVWFPARDATNAALSVIICRDEVDGVRFTRVHKLRAAKEWQKRRKSPNQVVAMWYGETDRKAKAILDAE